MGWDPHFGFQLYQSDPSGNYGGWKATCIGNNHQVSQRDNLDLNRMTYFTFISLPPHFPISNGVKIELWIGKGT